MHSFCEDGILIDAARQPLFCPKDLNDPLCIGSVPLVGAFFKRHNKVAAGELVCDQCPSTAVAVYFLDCIFGRAVSMLCSKLLRARILIWRASRFGTTSGAPPPKRAVVLWPWGGAAGGCGGSYVSPRRQGNMRKYLFWRVRWSRSPSRCPGKKCQQPRATYPSSFPRKGPLRFAS